MNGKIGLKKAMTVAAVAVTWGAGTALADIVVLNAPTPAAMREGTATPATIAYTVSSNASVLVVELAQKAPTLAPAFSWGGTPMIKAATAASDGTIRQVSIFYLFSPGPGTSNLVGSSLSTTYWSMNAFTLSGVDTTAGIKTGTGFVSGTHSNVSATVNSIVAGAAAVTTEACNNDYMVSGGSPNPFNGFTFTGTGGTASTQWTNNSVGTTTTISGGGLITNLAAGSDIITGTILPPGGTNYVRNVLATVIFAPTGAAPAPAPVMGVQGNSNAITNGAMTPSTANYTDFGSTNVANGTVAGGTVTRTFAILNTGNAVLNLTGSTKVTVGGAQATEFTVTSQPVTPVAVSNGTTSFQVTFAPLATGLRSATVSIANDDPTNNPYVFAIQGTGTGTGTPISVVAKWCVGGSSVAWGSTANWSLVSTATNPNPASVPGAADTAVFNISGQNTPMSMNIGAGSVSGMVFRSAGSVTLGGSLILGAGGMTINPGAGGVLDDLTGDLTLTLSADQTWMSKNGSALLLQTTPVNGGGKGLTLVRSDVRLGLQQLWHPECMRAAFTNMSGITLAEGAAVEAYNSNQAGFGNGNRLGDAADIISYGGALSYPYPNNGGTFAETVNAVRLVKGTFTHRQDASQYAGYANVFTYAGGLIRTEPTATLIFSDAGNSIGTQSSNGQANRVVIAGQAKTNFIGSWAIYMGKGFASYDPTTDATGYPIGVYQNPGAALSGYTSDANGVYQTQWADQSSAVDITVGALAFVYGGTAPRLLLNGYKLTIVNGGLTFDDGGNVQTITNGTVTAGTGSDTNLYVFVAVGGGNNSKVISATIANNGAGKVGLVKSGAYVLTLTQPNTYSGNTTINDGTIYLSTAGSIANSPAIELLYGNFAGQYYAGQPAGGARLDVSAQSSPWTLGASQTLKGNGAVIGNVNVNGTVAPGANTGILTVTGNVAFANNATLQVNVKNGVNAGDVWGSGDTWNAGYGRLQVYGTVNLGANAILDLEVQPNATLAISNKLFIVTGASALAGQFKTASGAILNQGDTFTTGGKSYQISYTGKLASQATSGGNDVVLQVQTLVPPKGTLLLFM